MQPLPRATRAPQVVAHRGASEDAPEHTLAAYQKAVEDGADALECDVRLTSDGVLVCVHDRRVDRTSNGVGPVSTLELADLAQLDFGAWRPHPRAGVVEAPDTHQFRVLTLETLLEYVVSCDRRVEVAIETKHPTRYAGYVEQRLVETLDRFGLAHPRLGQPSSVRVMSFSWLGLRRVRALAPSLQTVYLMERVPLRLLNGTLPTGVRIAGPSIEIVRAHPRFVQRLRRNGYPVHVWTVNTAEDVDLCRRLEVAAVITDRPGFVREHLRYG